MIEINKQLKQKPVIFLAFANDRVDNAAYLRNLPKELRGIREELEKAKNKNLCEVVERSNASIEDILDVFQDDTYKNRIAFFHYGGHASGYRLLLESLAGGHAPAHREGLAAFLARQEGLKFVFLNGCSTQQHALELTQAGIPAVVGTSQSIDDEVATNLAIRFYSGIANGASLERGWLDAEDYIKTQKGTANFRALYWEGKEEIEDRFPWDIFYKKGGEKVKGWNLPEAANDPLFGMPEIPGTYGLPETPYLFLDRYERKNAKLFFGRSLYIRELYNRITDPKSPPIILMYGQSGVGKSSLLDAGIIPRIEGSHTVLYIRRNQKKGLFGSLEESLRREFSNIDPLTLGEKWKQIESQTNKPLVVILDQVEEVFTRPNTDLPDEFQDFTETVKKIFEKPALYPGGKLILGYRKEYHPEIDKAFGVYELPRAWVFLQPLDRRGIMEVVTGLTQTSELIQRYNVKLDEELPIIIADDLLADKNSPVAPVLQILLTKMWNSAKKDEFSPSREFTVEQYQALKRQGIAMKDFFEQQMEKLKNWKQEVVESGLALDILKYHTTEMGNACSRGIEELHYTYANMPDILEELIKKLKDFYLLTDVQQGKVDTSLAHDTLAPVVIGEYNDSDRPSQRASRILAAKIDDFKKNKNKQEIYLDEVDLEIVEEGKKWMRAWDQDEEQLVAQSRERRAQREKKEKRNKTIRMVLVLFIFIFAVFAAIFAVSATHQKRIALDQSRTSQANHLAAIAEREVEKDPTMALRIAEKASQWDKNKIVIETRQRIYRENNFYKIIAEQEDSISCAAFSHDGKYILTGSAYEDKNAYLWNLNGEKIRVLEGHKYCIISIAFSPDGKYILTGSKDRTARLWDLQKKKEPMVLEGHKDWVYSVAFSPGGEYILTGSRDRTARLWDLQGNLLQVFAGHTKDVLCAVFSPNGKYVLTGSVDETARLWDLQNKKESVVLKKEEDKDGGDKDREYKDWVYSAAFSPDGKHILTGSRDKTACLWDLQGNRLRIFRGHKNVVSSVAFSRDGNYILTGSWDKTARLWSLKGKKLQDFIGHENSVTSAVFSPDGESILTGSWDKSIRIWSLNGIKFQVLVLPVQEASVTCAAYSPNDKYKYIITGLTDGTAHLCDLQGQDLKVFRGHKGPITSASFSPKSQYILTGSADQTACLWSLLEDKKQEFKGHKDRITSVAFSPDDNCVLTASWDNTARLWDLQGKMIHEFKGHKDDVNSALFAPDGKSILTASWDHTVILWNIQGDMIRKFTSPGSLFSSAAFSRDGKYILTGSNDGIDVKVRLWDMKGNVIRELKGHRYRISSVAFSKDGQYILTGSWDKTARLWDLQGNELQVFSGHNRKVNSVAFSPDRKHILTGSADNTVRIWEIRMLLEEFLKKGICEELPEEQIKEK